MQWRGKKQLFFFPLEYNFDRIYKNFVPTTYELEKKKRVSTSGSTTDTPPVGYTLYMKIYMKNINFSRGLQRIIALSELVTSNDQSIS